MVASQNYGGSNLQADLQKAAWLTTKFWDPANAADWKGIHYAIWSLTSGIGLVGTDDYLKSARDWVEGHPEWGVRSSQSMLVQSTVTPEPETYLLMATGLIFLAFFGRRRFKENGYF